MQQKLTWEAACKSYPCTGEKISLSAQSWIKSTSSNLWWYIKIIIWNTVGLHPIRTFVHSLQDVQSIKPPFNTNLSPSPVATNILSTCRWRIIALWVIELNTWRPPSEYTVKWLMRPFIAMLQVISSEQCFFNKIIITGWHFNFTVEKEIH